MTGVHHADSVPQNNGVPTHRHIYSVDERKKLSEQARNIVKEAFGRVFPEVSFPEEPVMGDIHGVSIPVHLLVNDTRLKVEGLVDTQTGLTFTGRDTNFPFPGIYMAVWVPLKILP